MDERYLKRAVENLIANCIKHNPPGTKIKVILYQDVLHDNEIQITIEDDGIGMDEETVECLFDRYFRGISASSNNRDWIRNGYCSANYQGAWWKY